MEFVMDMLVQRFGPMGPLFAVGGLGFLLILLTLPFLLQKKSDPMDKFRDSVKASKSGGKNGPALRIGGKHDKLEKYSNFLEPQNEEEYSAIRMKLIRAGYRGKNAVRTFHFAQFALGIGLLILGVIYTVVNNGMGAEVTTRSMVLSTLIPGFVGYYAPKYWVTKRIQERQEQIVNGFPDSLDMMLVCVEAGQSMDHSIARVSKEIRAGYPALADEYAMVSHEIKAGKDKTTVLKDMGERAGVSDVSNFVTVLIQSAAFGTSVAEALRVYASEMRDKRVMRAEEKANTLPTKMTLATMMLTVPPLLIILLGPSIYNIVETLGKMSL
ncbi:tight adherence protein C [Palleronia salina]|uniref:Tight adherence protein C n=1 Tax=Palleronia salina TaxID=313368 RepID=A0A1M6EX60_9RHOB|nr:type II secretion system F family protein [Palleronia salina]SHI89979.1 tight adherence protein C [Palleronia salina]